MTAESCLGTGTLYHQISDTCFVIATCAHNFLIFKARTTKKKNDPTAKDFDAIKASTNGTTFYLQRDGKEKRVTMRVIDIAIHPDYYQDGNSASKFLKGSDIAFAVVEIPFDDYRMMSADEKKKF